MLQQPLHQLAAGVFGRLFGPSGSPRQQHLALDVNQQRSGVDELARHVHVAGLQLVHIGQKLRGDLGDGNVVNVDVLLANQVQQQIQRAVIHLAHKDRKGRLFGAFVQPFLPRSQFGRRFFLGLSQPFPRQWLFVIARGGGYRQPVLARL